MKLPTALGNQLLRAQTSSTPRPSIAPLVAAARRGLPPPPPLPRQPCSPSPPPRSGAAAAALRLPAEGIPAEGMRRLPRRVYPPEGVAASVPPGRRPLVPRWSARPLGRQNTSLLSRSAEGAPRIEVDASVHLEGAAVRMIESDGSIVGFASPYDAPAPLPSITAMTKTDLPSSRASTCSGCSTSAVRRRRRGCWARSPTGTLDPRLAQGARGTSLRNTDANSSRDLADEISARGPRSRRAARLARREGEGPPHRREGDQAPHAPPTTPERVRALTPPSPPCR